MTESEEGGEGGVANSGSVVGVGGGNAEASIHVRKDAVGLKAM